MIAALKPLKNVFKAFVCIFDVWSVLQSPPGCAVSDGFCSGAFGTLSLIRVEALPLSLKQWDYLALYPFSLIPCYALIFIRPLIIIVLTPEGWTDSGSVVGVISTFVPSPKTPALYHHRHFSLFFGGEGVVGYNTEDN